MHRRVTFGSRHRRRGSGHYRGLIRAGVTAALAIALAACATTSRYATPARSTQSPYSSLPSRLSPPHTASSSDAHAVMVDSALSMLGQPYRFGGAAPGGFDCSGLVEYAASGAGVRLPRTAKEQLSLGEPIARDELQAGDLIFMHLAHKELHVAIALDQQRFVHAPSTGGYVRIDTLAASPYAKGFLSARRITVAP